MSNFRRKVLPPNCKLFSIQVPVEIMDALQELADQKEIRRGELIRSILADAAGVKWDESAQPFTSNRVKNPSDSVFEASFRKYRKTHPDMPKTEIARLTAVELGVPFGTAARRLLDLGA
jgi:hypothetical protein